MTVSPWGASSGAATATPSVGSRGRLYVQRNGTLVRVPVEIVLANGTQAAVTPLRGAALAPGDPIVVGDSSSAIAANARSGNRSTNPFVAGGAGGGSFRGMH